MLTYGGLGLLVAGLWFMLGGTKFIKDEDGNGYFSPGSLDPYFMPEKAYEDPTPFEVKAKWNVEGFNLFPGELKNAGEVVETEDGEGKASGKGRTRTDR